MLPGEPGGTGGKPDDTQMTKVLIVTNDYPPRSGGIQSFVHALACRLPADSVVVYAPAWAGAAEFDATLPFPVVRHPGSLMLPVPAVRDRARALLAEHGCDTVLFGAAAPLGLLAPSLRAAGARRIVALTHGHEAGWAALPGARWLLRRIGEEVDVLTYLAEYFRVRLARALTREAAARMVRLAPGVDPGEFRPGAGGTEVRKRLGIDQDRPVVICVSRMVRRKGQDTLIRAWPLVLAQSAAARAAAGAVATADRDMAVGDRALGDSALGDSALGDSALGDSAGGDGATDRSPLLLLVSDGPYRSSLERLAARLGVADSVLFTGPVGWDELPAYYDAGDVFAMPCRTRRGGLDVEGLGIVYLEASATGLPVIGGDSGGAPDAILDGETGYVAPGRNPAAVAARISQLLADPAGAAAMGDKGQAWVEREWTWQLVAERLQHILAG
jgi:phosphatidylinositol alpha-1,6-mannosyltransferase